MGNVKRTLAPLLVLGFVLSGCAQAPEESVSAQYVPPAWMAEAKEQFETSRNEYINCLTRIGIGVTEANNGEVGFDFPQHLDPESPEIQALFELTEQCQHLSPTPYSKGDSGSAYEMMLDTHECLVAQGYPLSVPPSREVWIEEFIKETSGKIYFPYWELDDLMAEGKIEQVSVEELGELQRSVCIPSIGSGGIASWVKPEDQ